jgi:hypothetical protein
MGRRQIQTRVIFEAMTRDTKTAKITPFSVFRSPIVFTAIGDFFTG